MTQVGFYHLTKSSLEQVLPKLLEKVLAAKKRAVVKVGSPERLASLNAHLWNAGRGSFLPHGSSQDGNGADQPIWLTTEDDNPNGATFLILTEDLECPHSEDYERVLDVFDGTRAESLQLARSRWKLHKDQGREVVYWKQTTSQGWERG